MFKKLINQIKAFGKTTVGLLVISFISIVAGIGVFSIEGKMARFVLIATGLGWILTGLIHLMEAMISYWDAGNDDDDEINGGGLGFR